MGVFVIAAIGLVATTGMGAYGTAKANREADHGAMMQGLSNDLKKSMAIGDSFIIADQMRAEAARESSTATTVAAAQGRRSDSGSVAVIDAERKSMLAENQERIIDTAQRTGEILDLGSAAAKRSADAAGDARSGYSP